MLRYLLRYLARCWVRALLTLAGISIAIAAIVFAYGVAGWVDLWSSRSLSHVLGDATIWVVPARGVTVDPGSGLIVPQGHLAEAAVQALKDASDGHRLYEVLGAPVLFAGERAVLYGDARESDSLGATVSEDLWRKSRSGPGVILIGQQEIQVVHVRQDLPPRALVTSLNEARRVLGMPTGASWLLSNTEHPLRLAHAFNAISGVRVSNSPMDESRRNEGQQAIVYLIEGTLARFDPFSFRTKFSALVINSSMSTLFGVVARLIFLIGVVLAVSSSMIGLRERRDEIALLAVAGLEANVIVLFLLEACMTQSICFVLGSGIGFTMLYLALQSQLSLPIAGQAVGFSLVYLPILVVLTTMIPSQAVAGRRPVDLVRRNM